jgi:molybdopterin converting factor small subunit
MAVGCIRYWAAAKDAAGVAEETYDATTLADALASARAKHSSRFADVLSRCSFLVNEAPVGARDAAAVTLFDGDTVEVLPPFAGG